MIIFFKNLIFKHHSIKGRIKKKNNKSLVKAKIKVV